MKLYKLHSKQFLNVSIDKAWDFFSDPNNLNKITPPKMGFNIKTTLPDKMYAGMLIEYKVKPILNIPLSWVTEITQVDKPNMFIDEQRFGPYKFWHHQHIFRQVEGGIEMEDIVHYGLPLGFLGRMAHPLIVKPQLDGIFKYREKFLKDFKF